MNAPAPAPAPAPATKAIPESDCPLVRSRADFAAAVVWAAQAAIDQGARRMVWSGDTFDDWPFDDGPLLQALGAWLRLPQRRLLLLARDFESVRAQQPRFMGWRRDYSHALEAWTPPEEMGLVPTLLVSDTAISLQVVDKVRWRGRASADERKAHLLREQLDAFLQRSERAFPVHQLGL